LTSLTPRLGVNIMRIRPKTKRSFWAPDTEPSTGLGWRVPPEFLCSSHMVKEPHDDLRRHAFISYVREDRDHVDRLQGVLESAGIRVWRDTENLWPGQDWKLEIRRAIAHESLAFIACFSENTERRETSYQNEELILAVEQMRLRRPERPWLLPIRFDDCRRGHSRSTCRPASRSAHGP
jgi:hypothetical protein